MDLVVRRLFGPDLYRGFLDFIDPELQDRIASFQDVVKVYHQRLNCRMTTLLALNGKTIVGTCSVVVEPTWRTAGTAIVRELIVRRTRGKKEITKALLHAAEKLAGERGCSEVLVHVSASQIRSFSNLGYVQDKVAVRKDLSPSELLQGTPRTGGRR